MHPKKSERLGVRWSRLQALFLLSFIFLVGISVACNSIFVFQEEEAARTPAPSVLAFDLLEESIALPQYPSYSISNISRALLIPQRILRTWKTNSPREIRENSETGRDHKDRFTWFQTWVKLNPSATQVIFSDDDMDRFVRGAFSKRVVKAYFKLPRIVLRSDFARYMMLYELGGFYSDMDTSCSVPIHQWNLGLHQVAMIIGVENPGKSKDSFLQWTMASAPHHPLLANIIYRVTEKIHSTDEKSLLTDDGAVLEVTGPGIWATVIQEYLQKKGANLTKIANMWDGYQLIGDILILGKSYLNNDNSESPKSLIRHHFTGFSDFGWRVHGKQAESGALSVANDDFDFSYKPPVDSIMINTSKTPKKIPKEVIQVANSSDVDQIGTTYKAFRNSWVELNPGYIFKLFSEDDVYSFVRSKASEEERIAFFKLPFLRQRLELFRFLYLQYVGGFYTDVDTACRVPIDKWFGGYDTIGMLIGLADQSHSQGPGFVRSTLGSTPHHPVIKGFLNNKVTEILSIAESGRLKTYSFFDMFQHGFDQYMQNIFTNEGVNITHDFRSMSWEGIGVVNDVLVLGQERLRASHGRSTLMYVDHRNDIWSTDKGFWTENHEVSVFE